MLTRDKHEGVMINDMSKAVQALQDTTIDCIITAGDVGVDFCRLIQKEVKNAPPVIAILSATHHVDEQQWYAEVGVRHVLVKPIGRQSLKDLMSVLFAQRSIGQMFARNNVSPVRRVSVDVAGLSRNVAHSLQAHSIQTPMAPKRNALVVDDDLGQRMLLKSMLERENFHVDTVMDGDAAVKFTATNQYDMVLMDGFMPIKTGWQATEEIREREKAMGVTKPVVILGVTGATTTEDATKCMHSGMTDVVAKPIERRTLRAKIRKWCGGGQSGTPLSGDVTPAARRGDCLTRKVLCVGKEAEALKGTLSTDHFEMVTCNGAYEIAAGGVRADEYHVVIVDVSLQSKPVWDALAHVRAEPACKMIVVGVCERGWTGNMTPLTQIGVYEVLPVPPAEGALYTKISQLEKGDDDDVCMDVCLYV